MSDDAKVLSAPESLDEWQNFFDSCLKSPRNINMFLLIKHLKIGTKDSNNRKIYVDFLCEFLTKYINVNIHYFLKEVNICLESNDFEALEIFARRQILTFDKILCFDEMQFLHPLEQQNMNVHYRKQVHDFWKRLYDKLFRLNLEKESSAFTDLLYIMKRSI